MTVRRNKSIALVSGVIGSIVLSQAIYRGFTSANEACAKGFTTKLRLNGDRASLLKDHARALKSYKEAASQARLSGDKLLVFSTLNDIVSEAILLGDFRTANEFLADSNKVAGELKRLLQATARGRRELARNLMDNANLDVVKLQYARAAHTFALAATLLKTAPVSPSIYDEVNFASACLSCAYCFERMKDFDSAQEARDRVRDRSGDNSLTTFATRLVLAQLTGKLQGVPNSEVNLSAAMKKIQEKKQTEDAWKKIVAKANEYYNQRNYDAEIATMKEALALANQSQDPQLITSSQLMLGEHYSYTRRFVEAEPWLRLALAKEIAQLGKDHQFTGLTQYRLATIFYHRGMYEEAEPFFKEALRVLPSHNPEDSLLMKTARQMYSEVQKRLSSNKERRHKTPSH